MSGRSGMYTKYPQTNSVLRGKRCRCPSCGEVFSTISNFDKHRKGNAGSKVCVNPATVGLVINERNGNTYWMHPSRFETEQSLP